MRTKEERREEGEVACDGCLYVVATNLVDSYRSNKAKFISKTLISTLTDINVHNSMLITINAHSSPTSLGLEMAKEESSLHGYSFFVQAGVLTLLKTSCKVEKVRLHCHSTALSSRQKSQVLSINHVLQSKYEVSAFPILGDSDMSHKQH